MPLNRIILFIALSLIGTRSNIRTTDEIDVKKYDVTIEPNLSTKSIRGSVTIQFVTNSTSCILQCGELEIENVYGSNVKGFSKSGNKLSIDLHEQLENTQEILIEYHGKPSKGLIFNTESDYAYTVYFTSEWMICNHSPADKASISLNLLLPKDKKSVANGVLQDKDMRGNKEQHSWLQSYESPAYTFGFAVGDFHHYQDSSSTPRLNYYSHQYSPLQLQQIFKETTEMIAFFEEKSGVKFYQPDYSQLLIGSHYQEMSGFSVLKDSYGELVLADSTETNLISHELAHQWWGNQITCKNWNHFWLNEAMATFMSAAYNEHRFGTEKYLKDIQSYQKVFEGIRNRGNDQSLVFTSWDNPSKDDRNLVYFKGAYVLHLLREKMGNEAFWKGIRIYSQQHFGKSVETADFQRAMENSSQQNLKDFFQKWVY